jgi:uncharacterized protein (UPF0333 family)
MDEHSFPNLSRPWIGERAQITIEALFIMGVFILLIVSVSTPNILKAVDATRDIRVISDAEYATDSIATVANSITNTYAKKIIKVYIPGYSSAGTVTTPSGAHPLIWISTCISTDGDILNTTIRTIRFDTNGNITKNEAYSFTRDLPGDGWGIYFAGTTGSKPIYEDQGRIYTLIVSWKNITSQTQPTQTLDNCTLAGFAKLLPEVL